MNKLRLSLFVLLAFSVMCAKAQNKWHYNFGLGASFNAGNVNNCNISNDGAIERNDSLIAFDARYKLLYSSLIDRNATDQRWKETNFEINGGFKMDLYQYGKYSPFLACEMLTNKYKGYDLRLSGLAGMKYRIYTIPAICDYSISAAFVYDWTDFTDETFYQPSVLDFDDYIINCNTKLQTQITRKFHIDIAFSYEYRSRVPSENYKKHDFLSEVSFRFKY